MVIAPWIGGGDGRLILTMKDFDFETNVLSVDDLGKMVPAFAGGCNGQSGESITENFNGFVDAFLKVRYLGDSMWEFIHPQAAKTYFAATRTAGAAFLQLAPKGKFDAGAPKGTLFIIHSMYRKLKGDPDPSGGMWIRTSIESAESVMHDLLVDEIEDLDEAWKIGVNALLLDGKVYAAEYLYRQSMEGIQGRDDVGMYIIGLEKGNYADFTITAENRDEWVIKPLAQVLVELKTARLGRCEEEYGKFDFPYDVKDENTWEQDLGDGPNTWSREVFMEDESGTHWSGRFYVEFADDYTADVSEVRFTKYDNF